MNTLSILINSIYSQAIAANLFSDGGTFFMSLILLCLLAALFFLVRGFTNAKKTILVARKSLKLAADMGLLALVMGFLASIIGLISAFDSLEAMGNVNPAVFASGLKISLVTAMFGLFAFIVTRLGIVILRLMLPAEEVSE